MAKGKKLKKYTRRDYRTAVRTLDDPGREVFDQTSFSETGSSVLAVLKAVIYIVFVVAVAGGAAYLITVCANDVFAFVKDDTPVEVTIDDYATTDDLADVLSEAGVIKYPGVFRVYAKLKHIDRNELYRFVGGTYTVNGMMNYDELFLAFVAKPEVSTVTVTIPEGYTCDEIIDLFLAKGIGTRDGWRYAINVYEYDTEKYTFLADIDMTDRAYRLEGYLYPDTYYFYSDEPENYYINKILAHFNSMMSKKIRQRAADLGITLDEALTIASIIEEEAYFKSDFDLISSVIWNRLGEESPLPKLELDSTLWYALRLQGVKRADRPNGLLAEDIGLDDPYNTYVREGLTPSPICCPGYEAIICALSPATTDYLYFASSSNWVMYYAATFEEHLDNLEYIRKVESGELDDPSADDEDPDETYIGETADPNETFVEDGPGRIE